jgi:hypothetical protein
LTQAPAYEPLVELTNLSHAWSEAESPFRPPDEIRELAANDNAIGRGSELTEGEDALERAARLNRANAGAVGWHGSRAAILKLLSLPDVATDRDLAEAINRFQSKHAGLATDGILGNDTWALISTALDVQRLPAVDQADILARVNRILRLLRRQLGSSDVAAMRKRRQDLETEFEALPMPYTMRLFDRLTAVRKDDRLASTFHGRLARATRNGLIVRLARRFFREYELRFNPLTDTFSVDTNPNMSASDKATRKRHVNLLTDGNAPGILWVRLQARSAAALKGGLPAELPPQPKNVQDAVQAISDAQLEFFREWFPNGTGGMAFQTFQRAFERFANGELRDTSVPGHVALCEPNGGAVFLFAEFGFLATDLGFSRITWAQVMKTFVKMQEIFMHVYRERPQAPPAVGSPLPPLSSPPRRRTDAFTPGGPGFHFSNFTQTGSTGVGRGQSNLRRKLALRKKYDSMDMAQLAAAAAENLRRAQLMT